MQRAQPSPLRAAHPTADTAASHSLSFVFVSNTNFPLLIKRLGSDGLTCEL